MTAELPKLATYHDAGHVGVCVKDRTNWPHDPRTVKFYGELPEEIIEDCYSRATFWFWEYAKEIARQHGYETVYSAGRSGGWLYPHGGRWDWLDYTVTDANGWDLEHGSRLGGDLLEIPAADADADEDTRIEYDTMRMQREDFLNFAQAIADAQDNAEADFVRELQDELDALNAAREAALVKGEN